MDATERAATHAGIVEELRELFRAAFAWETWGRLLVHVAAGEDGRPAVVDVAVEDIVGDEDQLAAAFEGAEVRASLPAVARAVEALTALDGLDLEVMGGGTFVRTMEDHLAFLPGLVRSPSAAFERVRDEAVARIGAKNERLADSIGLGRDARLGPIDGTCAPVLRADAVVGVVDALVLATFSRPARSFVWAAANPTLEEPARRACSALLDAMTDRSPWEIATFGFATDEPTAWALASWVSDHAGAVALTAIEDPSGLVFVMIRAVRPKA